MDAKRTNLVVISGPSGCGKDTVIRLAREQLQGIGLSVSFTSRDPRYDRSKDRYEVEGVDYFFISSEAFEQRLAQDDFMEHAMHAGKHYGTSASHVAELFAQGNDVVILNIETNGAAQIRALEPTSVSVFIMPPNAQELRRRLRERGSETPEQQEKRYQEGKKQMRLAYSYDYVIVNDDKEAAARELVHILCAVRRRTMLHKAMIDKVNATFD